MIEHLEIPSTIVHIDSPEGRKQIQEEAEKSEHFWTSPIYHFSLILLQTREGHHS